MKIIEMQVGIADTHVPGSQRTFGTKSYFEFKKSVLREFGVTDESALAKLRDGVFKNEISCDNYCLSLIMGV